MSHFPPHPAPRAGFVSLPHTHTYLATGMLAGFTLPLFQCLQTPVSPLTHNTGSGLKVSQRRLVGIKWAVKGSCCWWILAGTNNPSSVSPWYSTRSQVEPPLTLFLLIKWAQQCTAHQSMQWSHYLGVCGAQLWVGPASLKLFLKSLILGAQLCI